MADAWLATPAEIRDVKYGLVHETDTGFGGVDEKLSPARRSASWWSRRAALTWPPLVTSSAGAEADTIDALERLSKLHESGALSDEEFDAQRAKVLGTRAA